MLCFLPKEWGRYCFHRCVSVHISGGGGEGLPHLANRGYPHFVLGLEGGPPPQSGQDGASPQSGQDGGTPSPMRQSSRANTYYVAGGMPLAFRQEDLLFFGGFNTAIDFISDQSPSTIS